MRLAHIAAIAGIGVAALMSWSPFAVGDENPVAAPTPSTSTAMLERSPMAGTFDNTVRAKTKDGATNFYFNRDGTFTSRGQKGDQFGAWRIEGDKVCTHIKATPESCGVVQPNRKVGDKWNQQFDGDTVEMEIVSGR